MDVLIRHISQEISQYVLIRIHNKHTQVTPEDPREALEDRAWKVITDAKKSKSEALEVRNMMYYMTFCVAHI
jgi:hypothetical protein